MSSHVSIATTLNPTSSTLLTSSISSLSSSRHASSQISKIYRQASTLFLTRRLPESLSTILPVISPTPIDDTNAIPEPAPISKAGKTTRIKVWSLYLTVLNAVVELDPEEGKQAFGSTEWRGLVSKVRDGEVWEEVVQNGYGGVEGDVDSDVVINLATLLLAHARTQKTNQMRLENYLAASTTPSLDISSRIHTSRSRSRGASPNKNGTDTPRDLNARVKILELYTLHVLLRNNEWEYAREFITLSSVLDEERREAFLQALQSLQDEQKENERREREEQRYQEEQYKREAEETRRKQKELEQQERRREEGRRKAEGSEVDYGVENTPRPSSRSSKTSAKAPSKRSSLPATSPIARATTPAKKAPPSIITRAGKVIMNLRKVIEGMAEGFKTRPMVLLQMLAFIIGLLVVLSRTDVKERLRRVLAGGWMKVKQTAGMGVKVSYI